MLLAQIQRDGKGHHRDSNTGLSDTKVLCLFALHYNASRTGLASDFQHIPNSDLSVSSDFLEH